MMTYQAKSAYQNKEVAENYDRKRFKSIKGKITNFFELRKIYKALRQAKIQPSALILDIPSGTGRLSFYLSKRGYKLVAADISLNMLKQMKVAIQDQNVESKIMIVMADAENLSFVDNSFDAIICLRLLGHIPPEIRLIILKELKRVTKKYLILSYYDQQSLQYLLRKKRRERDEWYATIESEIKDELLEAGLRIEKIFPLLKKISETLIILASKKEAD